MTAANKVALTGTAGVLAASLLASGWVAALAWIPVINVHAWTLLAQALAATSGGAAYVAAWFARASDEPHERLAWAVVGLLAIGLLAWWAVRAWHAIPSWVKLLLLLITASALLFAARPRENTT